MKSSQQTRGAYAKYTASENRMEEAAPVRLYEFIVYFYYVIHLVYIFIFFFCSHINF